MFLIIYIVAVCISYITIFKDDFTAEHLQKAGPFIGIISAVLIVLGIMTSLAGR